MKSYFTRENVLVTGGSGFIGSFVVEKLMELGATVTVLDLVSPHNKVRFIKGDCADMATARKACRRQDIVMNLAARVAGIEFNRLHQATMFRENMLVASTMIEAARRESVERFLVVSSACVYPHDAVIPTPETEGFRGEPEETNGGYGWAKRMAEKLGMYYAEEFGMKVGIVRPYNAYGPRDHFDPDTSHVIPALIKRVMDGENPVVVWGSGKQSRAFLYVEDLASGMVRAVEKYAVPDPINLGTDEEVTIGALVTMIIRITGRKTKVVFDTGKPDGSPRRNSDNAKANRLIGFQAKVKLEEGLQKTIAWYKQQN